MQIINDPNASFSSSFGAGIGRGLSEQLPKEIERNRLSAGLQNLEKQKNLSPFQFFTKAASIYGMNPQLLHSLGELSKQRMKNEAYGNIDTRPTPQDEINKYGYGPNAIPQEAPSQIPSITTTGPLEATKEPFIPRDYQTKEKAAVEAFKKKPGKYEGSIQNAINEQTAIDESELLKNQALQQKRQNEINIQNTIRTGLDTQHKLLKSNVPAHIYSQIEDKAINSVLPVSQGGKGFTEHQAAKEYGSELEEISKDFSDIASLGKLGSSFKTAKTNMKAINGVLKKVISYDGQEEFAKFLQAQNGLSPNASYEIAYPTWANPKVDEFIKKQPPLPPFGPYPKGGLSITGYTNRILPELDELIGKNDGPIAIAKALGKKGYDEDIILNYFIKNADKLFTTQQARQLTSAQSYLPNLNDLFIQSKIGKEL